VITYGPYSFEPIEIDVMTTHLQNCARNCTPIHYDDAWERVNSYGAYYGPQDPRLWHLLGYVSEEEVRAGRAALSAIVTVKSGKGANRPGAGFFNLEKELGRYVADDETTWMNEINWLFDYWPSH
jgi:hypothetical protein